MNFYSLLCVVPDFVPENIIQTLLKSKSDDFSLASVGIDEKEKITDYRQTKWLNLPTDVHQYLSNSIPLIYEEKLHSIFKSRIKNIEPPQFLRYDVGDHYDKHNDSESYVKGKLKRVVSRDISLLLYLNDDYEGGELEFTKLQLTIRPKKGMLIAFPSYEEFEHKVHPVTKGTRYTIVSWIETEKRIYDRPYESPANLPRTWVLSS